MVDEELEALGIGVAQEVEPVGRALGEPLSECVGDLFRAADEFPVAGLPVRDEFADGPAPVRFQIGAGGEVEADRAVGLADLGQRVRSGPRNQAAARAW
ncbi:hypothetical protein [Streptomyces malaysiensis]|uniref:hypothetical protein n=1 Tax=Streptomyces malaysiensis TaxID=92644 RepID=UPI0037115100